MIYQTRSGGDMVMKCDVLVVGAGPAGSSAARAAAPKEQLIWKTEGMIFYAIPYN